MIVVTQKDLGKSFNDGKSEGTLQSIFKYCPVDEISYVKLFHSNGIFSILQMSTFLENYKPGKLYPPKGTICECTYHNNKTFLKYSNGDGTYSSAKEGEWERSFGHHFTNIKIIK